MNKAHREKEPPMPDEIPDDLPVPDWEWKIVAQGGAVRRLAVV